MTNGDSRTSNGGRHVFIRQRIEQTALLYIVNIKIIYYGVIDQCNKNIIALNDNKENNMNNQVL